ncbi:PBECR2 nuclease fold domain-containing protein [Clostridium sp. SHJSY1]|uniref:PBECR3 domain-containing polyvalent protein n=1 Tax=Clostridium sp. SHJSY1 TaxID=2942483 RepID=UPI002875EFCC|nr:PBECR2 nuclease fold domain-containing protein [Clostridium sp. SHJSY1]MDS0524954.1 PBECR2 nuclease fold domain-containing protein [Clostridium sp. SHJSY1]
MRSCYKAYKKVGRINTSLAERLGFAFDGSVYASPGVINHIKKRHGKQLTKKVKENLLQIMEGIIENPDYIGVDERRGLVGALELIKKIDNTLLLGLEVDLEEKYIYVSTLYPITKGKINNRIYSGRMVKFSDIK